MKIGIGYDVHKLVSGRKLILGGVEIAYEKGLDGHSDADVLCHAIGDAILGAAKLGDIGQHFPDTEPKYKDANSLKLLNEITKIVNEKGFTVINVDSVVIAQAPKLAPLRDKMRENIASVLGIALENVGVKATTTEGLGFEGRGEGISAQAVALLSEE
ncbi:MAG: 2-C-methyl-D-erythritol 2,4-cyclodiphosphate synthase [Coriobacteriia bacterium]|nr:2-C-methyl-D-erythritol 2,4-cyclodiphosphate synthase [Coriobacteriia bacterium]